MSGVLRWALRALIDNATIKLLALGLALVLFLLVRGDREAVIGLAVPVVVQPDPQRVLVSEPIDRLRVSVRGRWSKLRSVTSEDLEPVRVDLAGKTDGEYFFEDQQISLPGGVRVVALRPPSMQLRFEPRVSHDVEVEPVIVGKYDPTFIMTDKTDEPAKVRVAGARSALQAVERIASVLILPHPEREAPEVRHMRPNLETEAVAMHVVMEYEKAQGRQIYDVHEKYLGYDVTSLDVSSGEQRLIEVKGLANATGTILLTPNERRVAEDRRDCYWLYIVTNCADKPRLQEPVKDPARLD